MHLLVVGLNHKSAPVSVREPLSFSSPALCALLDRLASGQAPNLTHHIHEAVVLSTCNRLEFYALVDTPAAATPEIVNLIGRARQVPVSEFQPHLYRLENEKAVKHLMRVAAGLDSMVLGEPQILGQVVEAYQSARLHDTAGAVLSRLFQLAAHAGKRARTETGIALNPASISSVAIRLAEHHLGDLSERTVMILGAGEMGALALNALLKRNVQRFVIVTRTRERAAYLAAQWPATVITYDELGQGLQQADFVVASTGAPHTILHRSQVARALETRNGRPLFIIDIALPRDVEPAVGELPNVHLYNIDHLQSQAADNLKEREREIPQVEAIVAEETAEFMRWYRSRDVVPTLKNLRSQFDSLRQEELERALQRMQHLDPQDQQMIAEFSRRLMNKFLHQPTVRLKAEAAQGNGVAYTTAVRRLFGLEKSQQQ